MVAKESISKSLKEKILVTYKNSNKNGIEPYIFGVPFSLGSIGMLVLSVSMFLNADIVGGLIFLLIAAPLFALIAYFFGFSMIVTYNTCVKAIKNESYILKRAICNTNSTTKRYRYHDSDSEDDYSILTFINKDGEYKVNSWGRFTDIVPGKTYILVFFRPNQPIAFICDEESEKVTQVNTIQC